MIAGTPTIAALGASYAVGFSCFRAKTPNPDLLTALRAVRLRCGWMIDRDEENGRKYSTHQTRPSHTKFLTRLLTPEISLGLPQQLSPLREQSLRVQPKRLDQRHTLVRNQASAQLKLLYRLQRNENAPRRRRSRSDCEAEAGRRTEEFRTEA